MVKCRHVPASQQPFPLNPDSDQNENVIPIKKSETVCVYNYVTRPFPLAGYFRSCSIQSALDRTKISKKSPRSCQDPGTQDPESE